MRGSHRDRGVEAKASLLARSDSARAEVARMVVDDGAAHAEKTSELLRVHQRTRCGDGAAQPLRDEVRQVLELVVVEADRG